ncbi:MAG: acyl-CoA dehydratase activase [Clostridiales bacterium]|nr:acyl-CoA dehydratase activase [Clostridiales bacterium]
MIAYMCKYAPIEILEAFGDTAVIMEPHVANFNHADSLMHPNICSYVKAVLEEFECGSYGGMIFTTCCDSSRRLFDTLKRLHPEKFFFCFDLPRKNNDFAVSLYKSQMKNLIEEYSAFSGRAFDAGKLADICDGEIAAQERKRELLSSGHINEKLCDISVCLAGARPGSEVKQLIEDKGARIALDLTCTGVTREYAIDREDILGSYAKSLLDQIPCMRMSEACRRQDILAECAGELDGIIYHTVKFCDIYSYEYTELKESCGLPMVKLETDATSQCAGQILTRVEAFCEELRTGKKHGKTTDESETGRQSGSDKMDNDRCSCPGIDAPEIPRISVGDVAGDKLSKGLDPQSKMVSEELSGKRTGTVAAIQNNINKGERHMYIMGIDSGSTSTNAVIINEKKEILASAVLRTGARSSESAQRILKQVLSQAGLELPDLSSIVSTGYGRVSIPFADRNVTEISCHGRGAYFLNPKVRTILDIGGQDSKAIKLNEQGEVVDFVMNDKCAAGTGRFLEMMAATLEVDISELGPLSLKSKEDVEISSMCTVFAESEVISLIAQNKETSDIAHGVHKAIAGKAMSLIRRVNPEPVYMMTGGVAKNPGVVRVLEEMLRTPLYIYEEPEIVGALGAALYGLE